MDPRLRRLLLLLPFLLAGCHESYSPNTYAADAAQEEANVMRGVIIGVRQVMISTDGTVGTATGGAVGALAGTQVPGGAAVTALGAIGGTLIGGIAGTAAAKAVTQTKAWEYIVQETGGKLVSVTQTSKAPLAVGLHVLVIADSQQARIVKDYTVQTAAPAASGGAVQVNLGTVAPVQQDAPAPLQFTPMGTAAADAGANAPDSAAGADAPDSAAGAGVPVQDKPASAVPVQDKPAAP